MKLVLFIAAVTTAVASTGPAQKFIVIGDWGGRSEHEVTTTSEIAGAAGMAKVADELGGLDFIVSVGDHFYEGGIKGDAHDKRFKQTYEDVYHQSELMCPWYVVAGNHDHNGNITAQLEYHHVSKRWNYPNLWHTITKNFTVNNKTMSTQLVALDGVVMMGMHDSDNAIPGPHYWDTEPHPLQAKADKQFEWFDKVMKESTADYLWVYSHYPIYSADGANNNEVTKIADQMTKYGASGYFGGHQHTMHYFSGGNGAQVYVTQGGGSRGLAIKDPPSKPVAEGIKWEWGVTKKDKDGDKSGGFSSVLVDDKGSTIRFHNEDGDILHTAAPIPPRAHRFTGTK